jgi:streptomycin 6-kinase
MLDELPELVRLKAVAHGHDGEQWLCQLPTLVEELESEWQVRMVGVLHGGSGALVAEVRTRDDNPAVLKLAIPDGLRGQGLFGVELDGMLLGAGRG